MDERWSLFWAAVETKIEPVLEQAGFRRTHAEMVEEESSGRSPGFMYERPADKLRASVDALERREYQGGQTRRFNWIRVGVGGRRLRHLFPPSSPANIYEEDGWVFVNEEELNRAIDEIVELLRRHLNLNT